VAALLAPPNALAAAEQSDNENRNSDDQPSWKRRDRYASPNQQQKATKRDAKAITDARSDHVVCQCVSELLKLDFRSGFCGQDANQLLNLHNGRACHAL